MSETEQGSSRLPVPGPGELVVSEVFGPTFQGEGPSVGRRAAFVRLGRCNLDCVWCDTPYTWDWERFDPAAELRVTTIDDLVARIEPMAVDRVVVTGGEPLLQQHRLVPFLEQASARGWAIEVETNGTIAPDPEVARLVARFNVSPKLANSGIPDDRRVRPDALEAFAALGLDGGAAFKFVAGTIQDLDEIGELVARFGLTPVWVMPEGTAPDVVAQRLRDLADAVLARGWNLSGRLHITLWGDARGR